MATHGFRIQCPSCGDKDMEIEDRYRVWRRGECPKCGLFFEKSYDEDLIRCYGYEVPDTEDKDAEFVPTKEMMQHLHDEYWYPWQGWLVRVGYIQKAPETIGAFHVINRWFQIPSVSKRIISVTPIDDPSGRATLIEYGDDDEPLDVKWLTLDEEKVEGYTFWTGYE